MKNKFFRIFIITLCISIFICNNVVYALHPNVSNGFKQVVNIGGSNSNTADGITVSKTIEESNLENYFDITLKVNTTSKIQELITQPDIAIVIVMDISNTMVTNNVASGDTRYEAAMKAGETFIRNFAKESDGTNAKRQLGYVSFNTDAHLTFGLQDVTSVAKGDELINTMKEKTGEIINASGYGSSRKRFTNIEGGLKRAWDLLEGTTVTNKYVILISDGFPTTYLNNETSNDYDGYEPFSKNATESDEGVFANSALKRPCSLGTNYSDRGAIKARQMATNIKNKGINIMVVGTGIKDAKTIKDYLDAAIGKEFSTVDSATINYEIGKADSTSSYISWLTNKIASDKKYYDSDDSSLTQAYLKIFDDIKEKLKMETQATWVIEDPIGVTGITPNIEFLGLYDNEKKLQDSLTKGNTNQSDTASYTNNKISWNLKDSNYDKTEVIGDETHYIYIIKYRVRITNESSTFNEETIYNTNGNTTLAYIVRQNEILTATKYIDFPIPSVVGYLGNFTFTKKSSFDNANLSGAEFKLIHDPNCSCHKEKKHATINDIIKTSDSNGTITFSNIPSGHTYILTETKAPLDYELSTKVYNINVSYGTVTGVPENNIFTNEISRGNLKIQKQVLGNISNPGEFEFVLEVKYKNKPLTGIYNYKLNDTKDGTIDLSDGTIKLGKDDKIEIYNLPVGATYTLTETTTNGFKVEYEINLNGILLGETAKCDSTNDCRIEKGNNNQVKFINSAGYILPATGSSKMLILVIIGSLLLVNPIIYIIYSFYKHARKTA